MNRAKFSHYLSFVQALLACVWGQSAWAQIHLTLYQSAPGQVAERREFDLKPGATSLVWQPVAARILPESLWLDAPEGVELSGFEVRTAPLDPAALLRAYAGKTIEVLIRDATGRERRRTARVLSADGPVLEIDGRVESGPFRRLIFPSVPPPLGLRPALVLDLRGGAGRMPLELNYLCGGLSWRADYVARLSANGKDLTFAGWAALTNQSGMAYENARVALVAGQPHRVSFAPLALAKGLMAAEPAGVPAQAWQDYQRYVLPRPVTLPDGTTRWVDFLPRTTMPVRREYVVDDMADYADDAGTARPLPVAVRLHLPGMAQPLPAGVLRVYGMAHGQTAFLGEDRVAAVPRNTAFSVRLGQAFDVTASSTQTDFRRLGGAPPTYESAWRVVLRNAKPQPVMVILRAGLPGDWQVLQESAPHRKISSDKAEWQLSVGAESETVLSYRVRTRY